MRGREATPEASPGNGPRVQAPDVLLCLEDRTNALLMVWSQAFGRGGCIVALCPGGIPETDGVFAQVRAEGDSCHGR